MDDNINSSRILFFIFHIKIHKFQNLKLMKYEYNIFYYTFTEIYRLKITIA